MSSTNVTRLGWPAMVAAAFIGGIVLATAFFTSYGGINWQASLTWPLLWSALEAIGTTSAVIVALWIAARTTRHERAAREVKAAAICGEAAFELTETFAKVVEIINGPKRMANGTHPEVADNSTRRAAQAIRIDALRALAENADVLPINIARQVGSLLALLRAMQGAASAHTPPVDRTQNGMFALRLQSIAVETPEKIAAVQGYVWEVAGFRGQAPAGKMLEGMNEASV